MRLLCTRGTLPLCHEWQRIKWAAVVARKHSPPRSETRYMIILKVLGARRSTLAVHHLDSHADLRELLAVYTTLGYKPEALVVQDGREEQAA